MLKQNPQEKPKGAWDDFFDEPGIDLPDRDQPSLPDLPSQDVAEHDETPKK